MRSAIAPLLTAPVLVALVATAACGPRPSEQAEATPPPATASATADGTTESVAPGTVAPATPDAPSAATVTPSTPVPPAAGASRPAAPGSAPVVAAAPPPAASTAAPAPSARPVTTPPPTPPPAPRLVTIPANTTLRLRLLDGVASDTSNVEDRVRARLIAPVSVSGEPALPADAEVAGVVTYAKASGKVKGRAALTVRFRTVTVGSRTYDLVAEPVRREAQGTKAKDARDIGIGAGAGAVIGGIIGGRKGAGIGAAVGGAGGTGVVLATAGEEVRLPAGTTITTSLDEPLVVELPARPR